MSTSSQHKSLRATFALVSGTALTLAMFGPFEGADARSSDTVLYSFTGGNDGIYPQGTLLRDSAGNFYGTTYQGGMQGANGYGTVFKLAPDGTETVLHSFAGKPGDGANPNAGFIEDSAGNLYSTTINDGAYTGGTVFEIAADGTESLLYSFCAVDYPYCSDGVNPYAGLIEDSAGNFYGTTSAGGGSENCSFGCGTVFKLAPNGTETVLYSFKGESDGAVPYGGVIADRKGNLYGTTYKGGANNYGTVFKLAPNGTETVLYSFCAQANCTDGSYPDAGLIMKDKNLYGTTYYGGAGYGTVFEVAPNGTETVLHSFGGGDGANPADGLLKDGAGNFYGSTVAGGTEGYGTVFQLAPDGTETVLHSFTDGSDGAVPYGGLIMKGAHLYGTTSEGGTDNYGTVFDVKK